MTSMATWVPPKVPPDARLNQTDPVFTFFTIFVSYGEFTLILYS